MRWHSLHGAEEAVMTIQLTPELESRLKKEAAKQGVDPSAYASSLIAEHLRRDASVATSEEVEEAALRGLVPIESDREVIFTDTIQARIQDLPKWQPQVIVNRPDGDEDDDG